MLTQQNNVNQNNLLQKKSSGKTPENMPTKKAFCPGLVIGIYGTCGKLGLRGKTLKTANADGFSPMGEGELRYKSDGGDRRTF